MSAPGLRAPAEWSVMDGVTVMDPDGWSRSRTLPAKSFDEPISREEWEQRLSISTHSLCTVQPAPKDKPLSVVDRVVLRLMRIKIYGTNLDERYAVSTRRQWDRVLDEDDRESWRRAARQVLADVADGDNDALPCDWRAVHILPGTPYPDEPSEMQPPGWFVMGGFTDDPEEGAAFILEVDQALDRDDTGMSLERLAKAAAVRLNGGVTA